MSTELNVLKSRMHDNRLAGEQAQNILTKIIDALFGDDGGGGQQCSSCAPGCSPGCQPGCNGGCQGGYQNGSGGGG